MNIPEEASATMRVAARDLRDMYVALIAEGFTVGEALAIIGSVIAANSPKGGTS